MKFNFRKVQPKKTSIVYMGVVISSEGLKPDPAKVRAIVDMPDPQDKVDRYAELPVPFHT